jgi:N-acetylmuramoyl-L-alanine amidase
MTPSAMTPSAMTGPPEIVTATVQTETATPAAFAPIPTRKPPAPRKPVIAIDPGHGGRDPGAISVGGMYEKDITLAMGKELRAALVGTGRYRVTMTRDRDVSVRLRERVRRARQAGADLFLSIHADALGNPSVRGLSVYTLSEKASDAEAAALAERENKADIILGMDFSHESPDVTNILIDLAQRETMNRSVRFANTLLEELPPDVRTLNHSRRYAGFAVLKAPDVPSALLEMGYLSNHTDEKLLRQRAYRAKLAQAVLRSLDGFFVATEGARLAYSGGQ